MERKKIEKIGNFYSFIAYSNGYMWSRKAENRFVRYKAGPADVMQMVLSSEVCTSLNTEAFYEALYEALAGDGWSLAEIDYGTKAVSVQEFSSAGELASHIKKEQIGDFSWEDATGEDELQAEETLKKMLEGF